MYQKPTTHDHFSYTYSLKACSILHEFRKGCEIHACSVKSGHGSDIFIQNSLIRFYSDFGDKDSAIASSCFSTNLARRAFDDMSSPNIVSWTTIIQGLVKNGYEEEALEVFRSIDCSPNSMTLVTVLSACSLLRAVNLGKSVHGYSIRNSVGDDNIWVDNALLNLYSECMCTVTARNLFESMRSRDVISWTTMISGYAKAMFYEDAISYFHMMIQEGETTPNDATLITILSVCVSVGSSSLGQWVHSYMEGRHDLMMGGYSHLWNALLDMYVKFGNMEMAIKGKQAMQLFSFMLINGFRPDSVTFLSLLSACSHGGFVKEGFSFLKAMKNIYKIIPDMQHYACIVDMYGRAGLLYEAEAFVREMPVAPNGSVLSALLNAYKIHGDREMCDRLGQIIITTEGASLGSLRALANIYASVNRWSDAKNVEDMIKCIGVKKTPGCSWVEVH
ncbi:hypothetical protein MKW98_008970 [Papaver atlanticum]|uniref:Pentatricopeptide repeat-containing protein n=1 Tax=Papaver atlanticum TaxID=357466 RepID=A0AAD4RX21_9MAGN|nr:hypothetical protein MKW98_008970 [Papaver atlanticum]